MTTVVETLSNGLTVIVEEMPHIQSVAVDVLLPGGIICDPENNIGASLILSELSSRGADELDSRALSEAFDDLGIRHGQSAGGDKFMYRAVCYHQHFDRALQLISKMILKPWLPEDEISSIQSLLLQDIASLKDSPQRLAMQELTNRYYNSPHNRPGIGKAEGIQATDLSTLKNIWGRWYKPKSAILSVAGRVKADEVINSVKQYFTEWHGSSPEIPKCTSFPKHEAYHIDYDSAQLQIVLAYPSAKFLDKHYYTSKIVSQILSGGMFGRLFIEVREKRGLCYSVYLRHAATNEYGLMNAYAGTTPERAHETLQVMLSEINLKNNAITIQEINRAKANLKASIIIGEESASSRASSNASDWWLVKKLRSIEGILSQIEAVDANSIEEFMLAYPLKDFTLVTLGKRDLRDIYKQAVM
jgi:predicted Zn-dependent peptidase